MVLDAAAGLTRMEAENAFSLSLVRHGKVVPETLWELKTGMLKKSGLLTLHRGGETFADLGGLDALKGFTQEGPGGSRRGSVRARGVLLLGVPGDGEVGFREGPGQRDRAPDAGPGRRLADGFASSARPRSGPGRPSGSSMRWPLRPVHRRDREGPGRASSRAGQTDSGVSCPDVRDVARPGSTTTRATSSWSPPATTSAKLPPEFSRAERWDGTFFLDLPGQQEKDAIWRMYIEKFGLDPDQPRPNDRDWTGAEIKSCCRLAALLDVPLVEAARTSSRSP